MYSSKEKTVEPSIHRSAPGNLQAKQFLPAVPVYQKQEDDKKEEETNATQFKKDTVQRAPQPDEEKEHTVTQGKFTAQLLEKEEDKLTAQAKFDVPASDIQYNSPLQKKDSTAANTTGMPDNLKSGIENLSGMDMSDVQVHYNSHQPAQLNALAYAQGTDIHVAPGQEKHLPHEAWHVVQQKQGRVQPTIQMKGLVTSAPTTNVIQLEKRVTQIFGIYNSKKYGHESSKDVTELMNFQTLLLKSTNSGNSSLKFVSNYIEVRARKTITDKEWPDGSKYDRLLITVIRDEETNNILEISMSADDAEPVRLFLKD